MKKAPLPRRTLWLSCQRVLLTLVLAACVGQSRSSNNPILLSTQLDRANSVFAVVTHKGGLAAGMAHDHLVVAQVYDIELRLDLQDAERASFVFEARAEELVVDDPRQREAWSPLLQSLGVLDTPLSPIGEKDRAKIRRTMLGKNQLAAADYPTISARVVEIEAAPLDRSDTKFPYTVMFGLTVHGKYVETPAAARVTSSGSETTVEAIGRLRFSDVGIKPYSAFFGAVRNRDEFHVYVRLVFDTADGAKS